MPLTTPKILLLDGQSDQVIHVLTRSAVNIAVNKIDI